MQHALRRRHVAAALVAALISPPSLAIDAGTADLQSTVPALQDDPPAIEFADLSFDDALSRAERLDTLLVILWVKGPEDAPTRAFRSALFDDPGVRRWVAANATAVRIDAAVDKKGARVNRLEEYPTLDVLDVANNRPVERLLRGATAEDLLAAVYGSESNAGSLEKPTEDEAIEPFRWLAWANARYRETDERAGHDAVDGYTWCLRRADDHRPGFRARYFEFLLKRISSTKMRAPEAVDVLRSERAILARRLRQGVATRRDVYELTRVDLWTRKPLLTRDLFIELKGKGEAQNRYREWLFADVVEVLGRYRQYAEILAVAGGDPVGMFRSRIAALQGPEKDAIAPDDDGSDDAAAGEESTADGTQTAAAGAPVSNAVNAPKTGDERPTYTVPDTRAATISDASWVYEALLATGRGADARELFEFVTETYPLTRTYALFMERAMRLELWALSTEIADLAMAVVDAKGRQRMQRLLSKIPVDDDDGGTDR